MNQIIDSDILLAYIIQSIRDLSYEHGVELDLFDVRILEDRSRCDLVVWLNSHKLKEIIIKNQFKYRRQVKKYLEKIFLEAGIFKK